MLPLTADKPNERHGKDTKYIESVTQQTHLDTVLRDPNTFFAPGANFRDAFLQLSKSYLDPIAGCTGALQAQGLQEKRKKRKRGETIPYDEQSQLRLKQLYLDGLAVHQVWEQARRILEANRHELDIELSLVKFHSPQDKESIRADDDSLPESGATAVHLDEDGFESGSSLSETHSGEFAEDDTEMGEISDIQAVPDAQPAANGLYSAYTHNVDGSDQLQGRNNLDDAEHGSDVDTASSKTFVADKNGLNDGFFSIDDFNRQSEFLEEQDARGDPSDGVASDEDIDWAMDPLVMDNVPDTSLKSGLSNSRSHNDAIELGKNSEDTSNDEDDDGPIFDDADLASDEHLSDSHVEAMDNALGGLGEMNNTNEIRYADFFEPPPRQATKARSGGALPKTQPPASLAASSKQDDIQRTIDAVRRDIFEDDSSASAAESDVAADDADPLSRRSNHQKRQAKLAAEIRRLEAANVAEREWQMSGEARASDRPLNSLLEEDLDFERTGKPIPVITNEVSEDIETLIKRRILARDFDEVVRRRPENLVTGAGKDVRRGRFELEDSKPKQSLAEIYEAEHLQNTNPEGFISKTDEKLKAQHEEIERVWKDVSAKLDALTSWHYKPAPPSASINIVTDVPTVSMEDARPTAGGEDTATGMLAPQEVYKPGEASDRKTEVVPKGGAAVHRGEMSKDEKKRRRRREKERIKKAGGVVERTDQKAKTTGTVMANKRSREKEAVVGQLRQAGVKVIGRKGDLQDVEGKQVRASNALRGAGIYKL